MDKPVAVLIGAVTLFADTDPAQAAMPFPTGLEAAMHAKSDADLLKPILNAVAMLKEADEAVAKAVLLPAASEGEATVQEAQYYHHHHRFFLPFYRHHHHHGYYVPYGY